MNVTVNPTDAIAGNVVAPSSKAQTHRALVADLLSEGESIISNPLSCDDTEATANAILAFGAHVSRERDRWKVKGTGKILPPDIEIDCGESGVTLRFMIPIAATVDRKVRLIGKPSLLKRPLEPLVRAMNQLQVKVTANDESVSVEGGKATGGHVQIRGDVSSQFISGLLFAGPLLTDGLSLELLSPLESTKYVLMTLHAMESHGIKTKFDDQLRGFEIESGQKYRAFDHKITGDYSSAAFPMSAAAITSSNVSVHGLADPENDPDGGIINILKKMGANISTSDDTITVRGEKLEGISMDLRDSPDLGPIAAVLGAYAEGTTKIEGASRLRFKESDRLTTMTVELSSLGAQIKETHDGLSVKGQQRLRGGSVQSHGDHRVAMSLSIAALRASGRVLIECAECVSKSYPAFFNDLRSLGVELIGR